MIEAGCRVVDPGIPDLMNEMRKVLLLTSRIPYPADDGGLIATWNLSRCLAHNDHQIDLVCFGKTTELSTERRAALDAVYHSVHIIAKDVERQHMLDLAKAFASGSAYFVKKYYTPAYAEAVKTLLDTGDYDVALVENAFVGVYLPLLEERRASIREILLRQHNVEQELLARLAAGEARTIYRLLLKREAKKFASYETDLINAVDEVLAISSRDAKVMRGLAPQAAISVLNPMIDVNTLREGGFAEAEPRSLVSLGNMAWPPNRNGVLWFCREVWPAIAEKFPDSKFYIVGKNAPDEIRQLESEQIIVTGYVEDERPWVRRGHLFVVPLLEGSGVRMKILTALALGRPILSTTVGAEGIDWPALLLRDDAEGWVNAIEAVFAHPPAEDDDAVEFIRQHYDWRRPLNLGRSTASKNGIA